MFFNAHVVETMYSNMFPESRFLKKTPHRVEDETLVNGSVYWNSIDGTNPCLLYSCWQKQQRIKTQSTDDINYGYKHTYK